MNKIKKICLPFFLFAISLLVYTVSNADISFNTYDVRVGSGNKKIVQNWVRKVVNGWTITVRAKT